MIAIGLTFITLAIRKGFEPLLLVPIGFGILLGNIPYDASKLPLSVYDGPVSQANLDYYQFDIEAVTLAQGPYAGEAVDLHTALEQLNLQAIDSHSALMTLVSASQRIDLVDVERVHIESDARRLAEMGQAVMLNTYSMLTPRRAIDDSLTGHAIVSYGQGRHFFAAGDYAAEDRYPEMWSLRKQDPWNASVLWWLFAGVGLGIYPPLIFLGIGALTDFGPMLANPRTLLLGAAAQFGIFGALIGAMVLGFTPGQAASIGIIGGADGPTAIFTTAQLAPELIGAVALAAYAYMALVPIIQPPIIKLLTTRKERLIRMEQVRPVSKRVKVLFPIIGFLLTAMIAPGGLPLLGMLFFGNLLRECMVTDRLAKTAGSTFIDIVTILLGITVGAKTTAGYFLTLETIYIFVLGIIAFATATAVGVLFGKLMNVMSKHPINPMIGAAGVSAVPMSARVVHRLGQQEDPQNYLLMHAMGPNFAGVIGSAVAAGVLLSQLAG
ncbi:sodium ion-translocating decarboxylase subunit beta [Phycisphaerales bacterium AB-hyl4]|uniref:Sodium ion-translocating decarboxylase subunit beta n=1 Tax=Natronomicrosphaera hydrolytica TaxID=3242702 RepID=A0ABV4U699_9BACT